jgi:hypothetical protein
MNEGAADMNSLERFIESEARRELPMIMAATREAYDLGLRGNEMAKFTKKRVAEAVQREMARAGMARGER